MQAPEGKTEPHAAVVDGRPSGVPEAEKSAGEVAIDVKSGGSLGDDSGSETVKVCRICHLTDEDGDEEEAEATAAGEVIQIGCACKGELGSAHRRCAEAWFRAKGNRNCEICGGNAKNIKGEEDDGGFMGEWHSRRRVATTSGAGCLRDQPLCNLFVASLVIAFIILCFFRVNLI